MSETENQIKEILDSLKPLLDSHDCFMDLYEVKGNKVFISCGGEGVTCDSKCIEEVIKQKLPDIEIIYR
ncbi:hypothetical protein EP227_03335 [bacterium]|nr:MAG: hypothetical protein EP227_03335 [bacterium]